MTEKNKEESDQLPEEQPGEAVHEDSGHSDEKERPTGGTDRGRPEGDQKDDDQATGNPDNAG